MTEDEIYDPYARSRLYAEQQADFVEDIPLWIELAREYAPPGSSGIVELGSGSGRVSFALAEAGFSVQGLDLSPDMVDYCKAEACLRKLNDRAQFNCGDVRSFKLAEQVGLIIFPFNSLCHLHSDDDFFLAMEAIKGALTSHGRFVFHIFVPLGRFLDTEPGSMRQVAEFWSPSQEENFEVFESNRYDPLGQINHIQWFYQGDNDDSDIFEVRYELRMYYPRELMVLLARAGFVIEEICGDYRRSPADAESLSYTFICRKEYVK